MVEIHVPQSNPQEVINASERDDLLIFDDGVYELDAPLYLPGDRQYTSQGVVFFRKSLSFQPSPDFAEPVMIIFPQTGGVLWTVKGCIDLH